MHERIKGHFKSKLVSGIFIVLPLGITFIVLNILYTITAGVIDPLIKSFLDLLLMPDVPGAVIVIISVFTFILIIYLVGLTASNFAGGRFIAIIESIIVQIPLIETIYFGAKNIVDSFRLTMDGRNSTFSAVVFIEFPREGLISVGFVTGEVTDGKGIRYFKVFIPTTPNPTTGFLVIARENKIIKTSMTVEEGIKMIVSGGIFGDNKFDKIFQVSKRRTSRASQQKMFKDESARSQRL